MKLLSNFETYQNEIKLILTQNPVECELYSIIASIMRERQSSINISLRDVSTRRTSEYSKIFKSESGFPDFVILTKQFNMYNPNKDEVLGAIEVKSVTRKDLEESDQLKGHIKTFKNVIYTNGIKWKFYKYGKLDWSIELGEWNRGKISWNSDEWKNLLANLEEIVWI